MVFKKNYIRKIDFKKMLEISSIFLFNCFYFYIALFHKKIYNFFDFIRGYFIFKQISYKNIPRKIQKGIRFI